jgi:hypothetical protein
LTSFEASLEEARRNDDEEDGALLPIEAVMVDTVLTIVATIVLPHRALEIQRLWMNRGMRKPYKLTKENRGRYHADQQHTSLLSRRH